MIRNDVNNKLREFSRTLSPTKSEQDFVTKVYGSLGKMFGIENCIQIGSYPRYTATTPMHDLDILYVIGNWVDSGELQDPDIVLNNMCSQIRQNYEEFCPGGYKFTVGIQNHSVEIEFSGIRDLSVDIVPCYPFGVNSYQQPTYKVPHVIKKNKLERRSEMWDPLDRNQWILSDPRGYIKQAGEVGENPDFRKAVKIIKHWKRTLREVDDGLKLKSFHLEQVITQQFKDNPKIDVISAVFNFFIQLPEIINNPNVIEDRAQSGKYIDDYLVDLSENQKNRIKKARDMFLIRLEDIDQFDTEEIFTANEYHRDPKESFLFDFGYIIISDMNHCFDISYDELDAYGNREARRARKKEKLPKRKELFFKIIDGEEVGLTYYWKVQNSKLLQDRLKRRGEITMHKTLNDPETTEFTGDHHVECFGVNAFGECIRRARCEVPIGGGNE